MTIPNKQNPFAVSDSNSYKFTIFDDDHACQYLNIDGQRYVMRGDSIYGNSVGNPSFIYPAGHIFIGYDKTVSITYALPQQNDYCKVYSSENESTPIYELIHNGSGKEDTFTLPDIPQTAYYIFRFACKG